MFFTSKVKSLALASKPQVFVSRTALFFEWLKFCNLKNIFEDLFFGDRFFFWRTLAPVLCPWPREGLSSEGLSLALSSDFFCVLVLESCVTPPLLLTFIL